MLILIWSDDPNICRESSDFIFGMTFSSEMTSLWRIAGRAYCYVHPPSRAISSLIMAQKSYKLTYFPARGRGEFIRLAFIIAGVEFEDNRVDKDQWAILKAGEFSSDFQSCKRLPLIFSAGTQSSER